MANIYAAWDLSDEERARYLAQARAQYQEDGKVEIDDDAIISTTAETRFTAGYVQAWVWVELLHPEDIDNGPHRNTPTTSIEGDE